MQKCIDKSNLVWYIINVVRFSANYKEVNRMSEKERGDIMEALKELPEKDKQFVLGYAAGVSASIGKNDSDGNKAS